MKNMSYRPLRRNPIIEHGSRVKLGTRRPRLPAGRQGFTLIEILIAVSIIAILSIIGIVSYQQINKRSRDTKRMSDLEQVRSALEMYKTDNGVYPGTSNSADNFETLSPNLDVGQALIPTYMPAVPTDPKSDIRSYYYEPIANANSQIYGYCLCACLEQTSTCQALVSNTCDSSVPTISQCNYYLKNP